MVRTDKLITTAFSNLARMEWYWCIFIPWTIYIHNNGIYMEHSLCPCTGMMWWSNLIEIWLLNKFSSRIYREENFLESWISTRLMMEKTLGCNSWSISGTYVNGEMEWRHQPQLLHKTGSSSRGVLPTHLCKQYIKSYSMIWKITTLVSQLKTHTLAVLPVPTI